METYRVGPNDVLKVEVFDEENLTTETKVSGQGTIKFPLIGEVPVKGLTLKEIEEALTSKLQAGYLKNPKLTLAITSYRNVYVSGEAKTPGAFPFKEGLTVLKAITLAGGWTDRASQGLAPGIP
ncbi:MAG: polysaccharide export protein [Nitrospirae bacterium]|nr:polysaccharide export protein [Nitrospirota bacterium]